jgi:hypothetical protein
MLRATLSTIFSVFLLGCNEPEKPTVEACQIDVPANECICATKEPGKPSGDVVRYPMSYCDKGTLFRPPEWKKYKSWVDDMEDYIKVLKSKLGSKS